MAEQLLQNKTQKQQDSETYARITAPKHLSFHSFKEHKKIEGFFPNKDVPDFMGCDRLLAIDDQYGQLQLGYDPKKGKSFLFARIKTSIYDTAPSRYQKELSEQKMKRDLKDENENIAGTAKRAANASVLLYKAERKPWSEDSVGPYLLKTDKGALRKTMPFLLAEEPQRHADAQTQARELGRKVRHAVAQGNRDELFQLRAQQMENLREQEWTQNVMIRKDQQRRQFFRKLNYAIDIQKHEMFAYYREVRKRKQQYAAAALPSDTPNKPTDENSNEERYE